MSRASNLKKLVEDIDKLPDPIPTMSEPPLMEIGSKEWMECQEKIFEADPSLQPPKKFWNDMISQGKSPALIGWIWYQKLSPEKRKEIRSREGKTYGKAEGIKQGPNLGSNLFDFRKIG